MEAKQSSEQKIWLWLMLVSSLTGISIWYVKRLSAAPISAWGSETAVTFSYFTNLSNAIIIIMAATLLAKRGPLYNWFRSPSVQAACSLYIAFVGLGFWFLLGGPGEINTVADWIAQATAHTLSPILGFIYWLRVVPKGHLSWRDPFLWLIYPILYLIYWLFRGPRVGYYPYFFIDVNSLGYSGVAMWSGALIVVFLVLGMLMLLVDKKQSA